MTLQPTLSAVDAYRAAADRLKAGEGASNQPISAFSDLLKSELGSAMETMKTGEVKSFQAITGRASVQEVVEAVTAAELSLQKVTAVRDRVISAYQEIIRMPI